MEAVPCVRAEWMTASQAAKALGVKVWQVARLARSGVIRTRNLRVHERYLSADVRRLVAEQQQALAN